MITIVGLGLNEGDITKNGESAILKAKKVYVKTGNTKTYSFFTKNKIENTTFDYLYDEVEDFASLNKRIIEVLLTEKDDVVFCVNGCGSDDGTIEELSKKTSLNIIAGVSYSASALSVAPDTTFSNYSAYDVVSGIFIPDKRHTVVVREVDNRYLASDVKLALIDVYGPEKEVIIYNPVKKTDNVTRVALEDLDRRKDYSYATTIVIPKEEFLDAKRYDMGDLLSIMERLLGEDGCPWDRAQTHESIRINLIEEAYELVDAIDRGDLDGMIEESGDVILQAVFHCMLGKIDGEYNFNDAISNLCRKLITRHTHIFGENKANNVEEALKCWTEAKAVEKEYVSYTDKMEKLPKILPSLLYAYKMQKIAVKCGFDWHDIDGTFDKLQEEIKEFKESDGEDAVMEAGDLLFSAVNPMRWRHIEPELALKASCDKFLKRFKYMEENILKDGKDLSDENTREEYWAKAKKLYK